MKNFSIKILSISAISSILFFNGCSSHEIISSSGKHLYNENFGLVENAEVDAQVHQEILAQNTPTQIEIHRSDPTWTTELVLESNAVTAENYVQAAPIFSYKYKYDPKFYDTAEFRKR